MKRYLLILLGLLLIAGLAACGGSDAVEMEGGDAREFGGGTVNDSILDTYIYLAEFLSMAHITERIHGTVMHEGRIYFAYVTAEYIVIESILSDGEMVSRTEIPHAGTFVDIGGFRITEEDNFALIFTDTEWAERGGGDTTVFYAEFNPQGVEISRREIPNLAAPDATPLSIMQAHFLEDGRMILAVHTQPGGTFTRHIHLLNADFSPFGRMEVEDLRPRVPIVELADGRVFVADTEHCDIMFSRPALREIDLDAGNWGETILIPVGLHSVTIRSLQPAGEGQPFDLYIGDDRFLFGFNVDAWENIPILDWMEARVSPTRALFRFSVIDMEQISVLTSEQVGDDWQAEHVLLTPMLRADLPEREVITVGGMWINTGPLAGLLQEQVMAFNLHSHTHRVEVVDYLPLGASEAEWYAAQDRLFMDIMTGQGPDVLFGMPWSIFRLKETDALLDLYPFLDSDPELNRSDFLPNILALGEAEDGALTILPFGFRIMTWMGMAHAVGDIDSWTFAQMRSLIEEAAEANMPHILRDGVGGEMSARDFLLNSVSYSGFDFIDRTEHTAHLDSDDFIQLLELAARLPNEEFGLQMGSLHEIAGRLYNGEQLLQAAMISCVDTYHFYRDLFGDEMVFVGWPSHEGGRHGVEFVQLAIPATDGNPEAAWEFVRQFLLPGVDLDPWGQNTMGAISLRIDTLEDIIADAMTPRFEVDERGNEVEVPRTTFRFNVDSRELKAMTQAQAEEFWSILARENLDAHQLEEIGDIIAEELLPFLAGDRSAEETARIMQNRVQTFLWERG